MFEEKKCFSPVIYLFFRFWVERNNVFCWKLKVQIIINYAYIYQANRILLKCEIMFNYRQGVKNYYIYYLPKVIACIKRQRYE